ncbi:ABC transporter substrate-binding protein [Streptomyces sp. P38-E01]|uniref:ABC transporter substrate-binding protein n=1 Tax=Streptomyces tardus TaxID=2780544 RepID=A0A949N2R3_9ACTN|nr:ABC transporter substrate-binding protein [Streptomyces tardus]MBU7599210.1 ABC transporter substrate-binding protein [Streptomyces tardus]
MSRPGDRRGGATPGRLRTALVALTVGALTATGCSAGGGGGTGGDGEEAETASPVEFEGKEESTGPAEKIEGARKGGTIPVLERDSYEHLDPAQMYVAAQTTMASLIHRRLTTVKLDNDGEYSVVGDLATDSGTTEDDGRTWKYTLKDDIRFEDGSPITSKDIRHTFERLYAPFITEGPKFVQEWLADESGAKAREILPDGPYEGDHLPDSVLETPDERTVIFKFEQPRNDLPYALSMTGYGAVSAERDTKEKYDRKPATSGPYKIEEFKRGRSMKLVRNKEWDPATDSSRHQYVDAFDVTFNHEYAKSARELLADSDPNAVTWNGSVDIDTAQRVLKDDAAKERTVDGYQIYVAQMAINMDRVKDHRVRRAIAYAMPNRGVLAPYGPGVGGELAGNYFNPMLPGADRGYDPFNKVSKPNGDVEAARKLLKQADAENYKLVYAHGTADEDQKGSVAVASALEKAGFDVQRKEIPTDNYYDRIGKVDNGWDIYRSNWGHDWASASTVIPPQYDGRAIEDGAANYAHVDDKKINSEIDRIAEVSDPEKAADEWFELSKYILEDVTPAVPLYAYKQLQIVGSNVGGVVFNNEHSGVDPTKLFLKK